MNQSPNYTTQSQHNFVPRSTFLPRLESIELPQDRPFNGFRIAITKKAETVVSDVCGQLEAFEMHRIRSRARRPKDQFNFEKQVEALVCDLAHREIAKPDSWLSVSLSKQFLGRKDRYRADVFRETLPAVIEHLASPEMEFLELVKGKHHPFNQELSMQTVIRAGKRLKDRIEDYQLVLCDFGVDKAQEIIILKDTKEDRWDSGALLQYSETKETQAYREELTYINNWLEQADIDYNPIYDTNFVTDTTDRKLRRYFNNGCFGHGGRLFGGFWQHMRRRDRQGIVIDGADTVTLDYGQMIARILYGHAGAPFEHDDAYRIPGLEGCRDGIKKVFSAMLYADQRLTRMPQGCRELFPSKLSYAEVADKIIGFHKPVAEFLYVGIGPVLTYLESKILLTVLTKLIAQGITGLPIHDAVIVAEHHQDIAEKTMLQVFKDITGIDGLVSLDN